MNTTKFWNPSLQYKPIKAEIDSEMQRVLSQGDLILREDVEKFEKSLAEFCGAKYAVGVGSGTDALFLSLKALGIGEGDEVITAGYTFKATIEAIKHTGANPIVVDVNKDRLISWDKVAITITNKTKAIIPVHIEGGVSQIVLNKGFVIEDACQAMGASKLKGDVACYSFYPAKLLGCYGDGGAIVTNDKEIADKIRLYRHHWQTGKNEKFGYCSRLDNLQAAVLNVKLKYLKDILKRRRQIARTYDMEFEDLPMELPHEREVYQDYVILVDDPINLHDSLAFEGIETLLPPVAPHIALNLPFNLPRTEEIFDKSLRLPCNETLTNKEITYITEKVRKYYA